MSAINITMSQAEPILPVRDVVATVNHWHEVLGFSEKWTWGDPPDHGGVTWHGSAHVQFSLYKEFDERTAGQWIWIRVNQLMECYALHQKNKAMIVKELKDQPWGFTDYVVKENNGHYIVFASPSSHKNRRSPQMPASVRIEARTPTISQYRELVKSVKWKPQSDDAIVQTQFDCSAFTVLAVETPRDEVIGCAFLLGDNKSFYYVKDVIVHPDWQGQRIGTALMEAIKDWMETKAAPGATVGLFTGDQLASFYKRFGFVQAVGMYRGTRG